MISLYAHDITICTVNNFGLQDVKDLQEWWGLVNIDRETRKAFKAYKETELPTAAQKITSFLAKKQVPKSSLVAKMVTIFGTTQLRLSRWLAWSCWRRRDAAVTSVQYRLLVTSEKPQGVGNSIATNLYRFLSH